MLVFLYFILSIPIVWLSIYLCKGKRLIVYSNAFFVAILFIQGLLLKPLCIALGVPSEESALLNIEPVTLDQYWIGSIYLLPIYLIFLVASIPLSRSLKNKLINQLARKKDIYFSILRLYIILLIPIIGLIGFVMQFPGLLLTFNKSTLATSDLAEYSSGGMWRLLISVALIISLLCIYNIGKKYKKFHNKIIFSISALIYFSFMVISDQRSYVLGAGILWIVSFHVYVRPLSKKLIISIISILIIFGLIQTLYRTGGSLELNAESIKVAFSNLVGRNGIEHSKTIYIIESVPEKMDYMYGKSFIDSIAILLPRDLFPNKSTVNIETHIARKIFGNENFGAGAFPPGLIAEMYLNFNFIGIFFGVMLAGWLSQRLDNNFDRGSSSLLFEFFYLLSLNTFGASLLGSSASSTITALIMQWVILVACYKCAMIFNLKLANRSNSFVVR